MEPTNRLILGATILLVTIAAGVVGYTFIEGWSFLDSLYMTVTTITTVGYSEVHPLSTSGRIFSIFLILGGMGGAFYALFGIIEYIVEGQFGITLRRRRMKNKIAKLKGHLILCGYGKVGEDVANMFKDEDVSFVVIDNRPECVARAEEAGHLSLQGDATSDEVLKEAGIEHARGLVAALGADVDNTYITLSARGLRPDLFITARASDAEAESKLKRAGADRIVSPNSIGARRIAMLALRPTVVDFIDTISRRRGPELQMENVAINEKSSLAGQSIDDVRKCSKATVLAINRKSGRLLANPSAEEKVVAGDSLIIMGTKEQLTSLEAICEGVKSNE